MEKRQFVYEREPYTAADDFDGYPFLYIDDYSLNSETITVNDDVTKFEADVSIVIDGKDNSADAKAYHDDLSDQVYHLFLSNERVQLEKHKIIKPTIDNDSRNTTVEDTGKPVIRRTLTVSFTFVVTMG